MQITTIGLDLAKNLFQAHAIDGDGPLVLLRRLARTKVVQFFATLAACRSTPFPDGRTGRDEIRLVTEADEAGEHTLPLS